MFRKPKILESEEILYRRGANLVVSLDEAGLQRFAADGLMWTVGMEGKEAIGGTLTITNYRLIFKAHRINRLTGEFSIPIASMMHARREARFPVYKLIIETTNASFTFVNWYPKEAIRIISENQDNKLDSLPEHMHSELSRNTALCILNSLFIPR